VGFAKRLKSTLPKPYLSLILPKPCLNAQEIVGFAKHLKSTIAMFANMGDLESSFDLG
jgi:hypothetical protein